MICTAAGGRIRCLGDKFNGANFCIIYGFCNQRWKVDLLTPAFFANWLLVIAFISFSCREMVMLFSRK